MIRMLLRLLGPDYAAPMRRTVALMTAAAVAEGLSYALLVPVLRALFGDHPGDARPWLLAFAGAVAGYAVLRYRSDLSGFRVGIALLRGVYHRFGDHLARLPLGWFDSGRVGQVSTLAGEGILGAMGAAAHLLSPFISASVTPLTILAVVLVVDWRLGLAALLAVPVLVAIQWWAGRASAAADAQRLERGSEAAGRVIEYLQAQPVLRSGGRTAARFDLLDDALSALERTARRSTLSALPGIIGLTVTVQAVFTALLALGAYLALGGAIGAAELLVVLVLAARCADPLLSLAEIGGKMRATRAELARLDAVLRTPPLPQPRRPIEPVRADLELDAVTLGSSTASTGRQGRTMIDGVTLSVPEGSRLAVVGPSGAGKSTLLQLLARFHDVDAGAVRLGGVDVRDIATETLMERIAIVFQEVYLFDGTIEENVRLGRPDAAPEQVRAAATAARLDEVVARLPRGWDTPVGEGGALLSGGERQRVSIARALLKDSPVILLDEITAALDPLNEAAVHAALDRLTAGRTVVQVAHRLRTVRRADRIAFLDNGRIVEQGTHDELLRRGGRYAEFWQLALVPTASE
ncbi:ABC transporter ATP-binding protein [Nocardia otitidiscaviarum]|uniref:ABC transporter ATP-binding protein n=1 Tax=Nocardia otitidiscaviarum TaxID=1823 RepID=A0A516NIE2_9NOCA|nr:ABC transporter ATP-binding protein [Nocardia otitidiscaviarum]MCP9618969.1 ABC transporter ATP-binding protein/permease [Nocardia otitidiscaviarum]QDP78660.1 ABC transporter ATP-binding protein [Nocardia otitidiscaviarum]